MLKKMKNKLMAEMRKNKESIENKVHNTIEESIKKNLRDIKKEVAENREQIDDLSARMSKVEK